MTETHPLQGARFFLDLRTEDDQAVAYDAQVYTPGARYQYLLRIDVAEDGRCQLLAQAREPADAPEAPPWTLAHLQVLGRQLYRKAAGRGASQGGPWQRKLSRWRPS